MLTKGVLQKTSKSGICAGASTEHPFLKLMADVRDGKQENAVLWQAIRDKPGKMAIAHAFKEVVFVPSLEPDTDCKTGRHRVTLNFYGICYNEYSELALTGRFWQAKNNIV